MPTATVPVWSVGQVLASADVNNWFVPLAGYKTTYTQRNTLTLSIDPDLQVVLAANASYAVDFGFNYNAASGGFQFSWTIPAGVTGGFQASFNLSGTGANTYAYSWGASVNSGTPSSAAYGVIGNGLITTAGTGGTFGLNWASGSGPQTLQCGGGGRLVCHRVG